ncbi:MAG: adenylate/guanylate cyclase domain-containing protein [Gammaproteobacteria bacterium]
MARLAFDKAKHFVVSLRFSILLIFITMFVVAFLLIILINYMSAAKTRVFAAEKLMHEVSVSLNREFSREIEAAARDSMLSATLIEHKLLDVNNKSELVNYTYDLAFRFNIVQAAFWGDEKGNFVITEYEPDDSLTSQVFDRNHQPITRMFLYRDLSGKIIKRATTTHFNYDPRNRPWYLLAAAKKKPVWTDVYVYEPSHYLGITFASPVYYSSGQLHGVFGLDIRLDWLSWYVEQHKISKNGLTFIVTMDGKLIAYPNLEMLQKPVLSHREPLLIDIHTLSTPWVAKSFDIYKKLKHPEFSFTYQGQAYLAVYKLIPNFSNGWLVAVVVPKDDFIAELKKLSLIDMGTALAILLIGVVLVSALVTQIVKPIKKVVKQMDKIQHFDLSSQETIRSRIQEVISLSQAVQAVRAGLKSFRKYVPAGLVRKLIKAGENARIGGTKKNLTILFSDIENFTALSENMDPNELMEHLCEYFDVLSKIIVTEKGTIDKYMGDSMMAFWGAPLPVKTPSRRAAHAVLQCMREVGKLNEKWIKAGKRPLVTRFGLHTGEAIVGNVGSTRRLNYTALGDAINLASRLESINKIYGTRIIVSDALYEKIKTYFILRKVDRVAVKGKLAQFDIYELLAENKNELSFDIDAYHAFFTKAFIAYQQQQWTVAILEFENCSKVYPADTLAPVFIKRCKQFQVDLPLHWNGVWKIEG